MERQSRLAESVSISNVACGAVRRIEAGQDVATGPRSRFRIGTALRFSGARQSTFLAASNAGIDAVAAGSVAEALAAIAAANPEARVLICGSLYLAGSILRENG